MKTDKDVNFFMQLIFKLLTFLQKATVKQHNVTFYYNLTKLHFKLYFGKSLAKEAIENSREFQIAQHRHGCMVVDILMEEKASAENKAGYYNLVIETFQKNLLLEAEL